MIFERDLQYFCAVRTFKNLRDHRSANGPDAGIKTEAAAIASYQYKQEQGRETTQFQQKTPR